VNFPFIISIGARPLVIWKKKIGISYTGGQGMRSYNGLHGKSLLFGSDDSALYEELVFAFGVQRRILFEGLKHN